jgi:hypothetical protein
MKTVIVEDSNLLLGYAVFIIEKIPAFRNFLVPYFPSSSCPRIFTLLDTEEKIPCCENFTCTQLGCP